MTGPLPLDRLAESYLDLRWHFDPVEGSQAGVTAHDTRLGSFADQAVSEFLAALRSLMAAVEGLQLDALDDEIDRTALLDDMRVADHRFRRERPQRHDPSLWVGQVLEGLYQPLLFRDRTPVERARSARARLDALPRVLEDARETLDDCPAMLVESAGEAAREGIELIGWLEVSFRDAEGADPTTLAASAAAARDALRAFAGHLADVLRARPATSGGVGREALLFRLRHQHSLADTPETLLRYAATLIEETERALAAVAHELGASSWHDALARLRADGPPDGSLVDAYRATMTRARGFLEENGLTPLPVGVLEVSETPPHARPWIPVAAYLPPGPQAADRTGRLFVTPSAADGPTGTHCRHMLAATAAHEGYPGHHVHLLAAQAQDRAVRRLLASPVSVEGWALYAEGLMEEAGFYRGPEERLFRLLALLVRAFRIPMDIGLHTGAITRDEAVRQFVDRACLTPAQAEGEVRRVFANPGYQLAYAVGRREVLSLRADYGARAGAHYTPRAFHDAVLAYGAVPWSLVRWGLGLDG